MRTIWKEEIIIADEFTLYLPMDAQILTVQTQDGIPHLWFTVDDVGSMKEIRKFFVYGTGNQINESFHRIKYIGTWQQDSMVWHLFEEVSKV